jgi:predicted acetyltransferase
MELEMRPVTEDELNAFVLAVEAAFGEVGTEEQTAAWVKATDPTRTLAVFDAGEIVANAGSWQMEMTVPGLVSIPVAGVTAVGVFPTHRRQGLLNRMMDRLLDDCLERNEAVAILTASESIIYGRYGYGWATTLCESEVNAAHGAFVTPPQTGGRMRRIDKEAVLKVLPGLRERIRRQTSGDISIPYEFFEMLTADFESRRNGFGPMFYAVHEPDSGGEPDGFVAYRYKHEWPHGNPQSVVAAPEFLATDPEVEAAMFRYLLDLDLVAKVRFENRLLDDHLRRRLANPRQFTIQSAWDHLWVRLIDVAAALPLRRYSVDGTVVIKVHDAFRPQNEGVYTLEGGPDGALCMRGASEAPDIEVSVDVLGAAYLGGVSFASLAQAGRCEERRAGGLRRADAMFGTELPPYCRSGF